MKTTLSPTSETASGSQPLSVQIVSMVADREGIDPTDLEVPLYDVINPEALDQLFEPRDGSQRTGTVEFTYYGYDIVVESTGDGGIAVSLNSTADSRIDDRSSGEPGTTETTHHCLDCEWILEADDDRTTSERSGLAIEHHLQTGHTIESADSSGISSSRDEDVDEPITPN